VNEEALAHWGLLRQRKERKKERKKKRKKLFRSAAMKLDVTITCKL